MSVIGRLDEQVESIIISPIGRRREDEAELPVQKSLVQKSTPEDTKTRAEAESSNEQSVENERRKEAELPVWLL